MLKKRLLPYIVVAGVLSLVFTYVLGYTGRALHLDSLLVDAQAYCGYTVGYSCVVTAEYDSGDLGSYNYVNDACYLRTWQYNYNTTDLFFDTCAEIQANTGCVDCSMYTAIEYRLQRRTCTSNTNPLDQCFNCTTSSFGYQMCPDNTPSGGGGGGGGAPTVDLVANPVSVASGGSSTLTWTVSNATSCSASASPSTSSWSGSRSASGGNELESNITTTRTFTINCSNSNGSASDSATVTVGGAVATFDLKGGLTSPYGQSVSGNTPLNGVDARFDVDIISGCDSSAYFDSNGFYITDNECSRLEYRIQCKAGDSWRSLGSYFDPSNDSTNLSRTYANVCDYNTAGDYDMKGEVIITKNSPSYSQTTLSDIVPIEANSAPGATCTPSTQTVSVGYPATIIGGASGNSPITCAWSGGGTPATSNTCNPFTTTYTTPGTKTVTFNVNAANGAASCQSTINVLSATPPSTTVDVTIGTTTPYGNSVTGDNPVNNVDVSLAGDITNGCGTAAGPNLDKCSVRYRVDCTRNGTWENTSTSTNVSNGARGHLFDNQCSYSSPGTYWIRGEMTVTKNSDASSVRTVFEDVPVYVSVPNTPAGASCSASATSVNVGQAVTLTGTPAGDTPYTCSYTAPGGTPSSSSVCTPFTTSFGTTGTKTLTFRVTDADGEIATCSRNVNVVNPGSPAGASCSITASPVTTGSPVTAVGTPSGDAPFSCTYSAPGGTPSNASTCGAFTTTYNTTGTKTITFNVTDNDGDTANCSRNVTISAPAVTHILTVTRSGQGTATSTPGTINCGSSCTETYPENESVTLNATPNAEWRFVEWQGSCSGTVPSCTVIMNGPKNITAVFRPNLEYEEF